MLVTEFELAKCLKSSYFTNCSDSVLKRRIRKLAKKHNIKPVYQTEDVWLFQVEEFNQLAGTGWDSNSPKEMDHRIGKLRALSKESVFEKARALTKKI